LQRQLLDLISGLVADAAEAGARYDKTFEALASCRVHALAVAGDSPTRQRSTRRRRPDRNHRDAQHPDPR
jgi:hypothetical protein